MPAISILSAVEGLVLVPGLEHISREILIIIACCIAAILFVFQQRGTERVADTFGPIMLLWFLSLSLSGMVEISNFPAVLKSINPYFAVKLEAVIYFYIMHKRKYISDREQCHAIQCHFLH